MERLIRNPGGWVRAERVVVNQDGEEAMVRSIEPEYNTVCSQRSPDKFGGARIEPGEASAADTAVVVRHIKKIKRLLDQQWECLCANRESEEEGQPLKHPDPKVNSLQHEMMGLVDILTSYYTQHGHSDGGRIQHRGIVQ